jgi:hypothetical protein
MGLVAVAVDRFAATADREGGSPTGDDRNVDAPMAAVVPDKVAPTGVGCRVLGDPAVAAEQALDPG